MLYFRLSKNIKISQKDKTEFFITIHRGQNLDLSFLVSPKYNIIYIMVFFRIFEIFEFLFLKLQNLAYM
jgi:hypothetical protein